MCENVNINVSETNETINIVSSEIQEVIDINVFETTEDVTLNITEQLIQVNINKVTGGGEETLAETLVLGNNTGGTDILLNNDDAILLENNSSLRKGTYDFGQNGGISRVCGVDYEDMWQGGIRHVFDTNGLIRNSTNCFNVVPNNTFDVTLRFKVGSIWTLDDGTNYICTDATTANAVWELYNVIPTNTSDLTNDGEDGVNPFITAADVTAQVNSDWDATSGVAEIFNKPAIPTNTSDLTNDGEDGVNPFITLADVPVPINGLPAGGTAGQILTKVDATDYNATWQENFADWTSVVKHTVKNNGLSGTITKGTAVYVTGSNGTNMLVGRASNTSEATSSKTMGLMQSDITTTGGNQTGFVITEGLIQGLNTAGQTAGDPVWLGVNGALIYGLANKPYAPAHLVFIGIVTKISAGNGEIFVKVQNGFELKEIHDVDLITTTPINGHLLGFDGTLWVNKTIAGWLGFTPVTDARTISTTAPLSGGGDLSANRTLSITQATTSTDGYLSSTNWNTFNNKFTLPALTSGSVLFSNGTTIAQDNSNLFWDDTNNRLGIGTATPAYKLTVNGTIDAGTNLIGNGTWAQGLKTLGGTGEFQFLNGGGGFFFTWVRNAIERMRLSSNDNLLIGTSTDAGYKLDVNGTARVATSLTINNFGSIISGSNSIGFETGRINFSGNASTFDTQYKFNFDDGGGNNTNTSGTTGRFQLSSRFGPTSGTCVYNTFLLNATINQTGGANGITRGLYINPTLTAAADFRAIEIASGITILGAATTAKASLRIPSGTAPTSPVNGDIWFDGTDLKMQIGGLTKTFTLL
jgi:hypothetical protein